MNLIFILIWGILVIVTMKYVFAFMINDLSLNGQWKLDPADIVLATFAAIFFGGLLMPVTIVSALIYNFILKPITHNINNKEQK